MMIRNLTIFTCTMALIASLSPCSAHSRPGLEFRRASTGEIYFQPTPPLSPKEGELWVDSRNGNQFYFLSGAWTFEDMGTAIASANSKQSVQLAASENASNGTSSKDHNGGSNHTPDGAAHNQAHSAPTALHEPRPLVTSNSTDMIATAGDGHGANGTAATSVTQATFGSNEASSKNPTAGSDVQNTNSASKSKSDGPHMSLTDALNADELVDLLRSIGAAH